jgi:5-methylcytosine-specific restriction endonuclease McrA
MLKRLLPVGFVCTPTTTNLMGFFYAMKIDTRKKIKYHERYLLFEKNHYRCKKCNLQFPKPLNYNGKNTIMYNDIWLEIDHIIPISKGGKDDFENKQTLCNKCNSVKGNKL